MHANLGGPPGCGHDGRAIACPVDPRLRFYPEFDNELANCESQGRSELASRLDVSSLELGPFYRRPYGTEG